MQPEDIKIGDEIRLCAGGTAGQRAVVVAIIGPDDDPTYVAETLHVIKWSWRSCLKVSAIEEND